MTMWELCGNLWELIFGPSVAAQGAQELVERSFRDGKIDDARFGLAIRRFLIGAQGGRQAQGLFSDLGFTVCFDVHNFDFDMIRRELKEGVLIGQRQVLDFAQLVV